MAQAAGGHGNRCGKGHTKHSRALGKACVKHRKAKRRDAAAPITVPAAVVKQCRDEQAADTSAFQQKYANAAGREALGRCIRLNAQGTDEAPAPAPVQNDFATAAQECAAEKAADAAAFVAKYADENGREAFGHCVRDNAKPVTEDTSGDDAQESDAGDDGATPPAGDANGDGGGEQSGDTGTGADEATAGLDSLYF